MAYCVAIQTTVDGKTVTGRLRMSGRPPSRCRWCSKPPTKLCDGPPMAGSRKKACDAPMCDEHAHHIEPDLDHCPLHTSFRMATLDGHTCDGCRRRNGAKLPGPDLPPAGCTNEKCRCGVTA